MPAPYPQGSYARIEAVVRRIPRGRVATYGQVATLAGLPGHARQVGYALHALAKGSPVRASRMLKIGRATMYRRITAYKKRVAA